MKKKKGKKLLIYYAHCVALYNSPQEARDIMTLEELGFEVLNPNTEKNREGYQNYKALISQGTIPVGSSMRYCPNPMQYFLNLVSSCDALAFRSLPSLEIPSGVAVEIQQALDLDKPVIELPSRFQKRRLNHEDTVDYLKEVGNR